MPVFVLLGKDADNLHLRYILLRCFYIWKPYHVGLMLRNTGDDLLTFVFGYMLISLKMVETCCPATYTLGNSAAYNPQKV